MNTEPAVQVGVTSQDWSCRAVSLDTELNGRRITLRAFLLGLGLSTVIAILNSYIQVRYSVQALGGTQMPVAAIFGLLMCIAINIVLWKSSHLTTRWTTPLSRIELLTIYVMLLIASLVSTIGTENLILTTGAALFYFSTRENRWADLFYSHIPPWFAPGWNGKTFRSEVIEPLYLGGLTPTQIPWHAWAVMLIAWGIFAALVYGLLFFLALLLRRQWIENEVLTFPLVQLPLQMVETHDDRGNPYTSAFWNDRGLWLGFGVASIFHFLRGMNNFYPDWPVMNTIQGNAVSFALPDAPWNAIGAIKAEIFFGGIGIAFLLTRDTSFSFWVFFLLTKLQYVVLVQMGLPPISLGRGVYDTRYSITTFQNAGGWMMMAVLLLWSARRHFMDYLLLAWNKEDFPKNEPFSPRCVLSGLAFTLCGLLGWTWFSGINPAIAVIFIATFILTSIVIARLTVEAGFLFPQMTFSSIEWLTSGVLGTSIIGTDNLIKLGFLQSVLMTDMRTSTLPAFLHVMKIAHTQNLERRETRRLLSVSLATIAITLICTVVTSLIVLYRVGGLSSNVFFAVNGPLAPINGVSNIINEHPEPSAAYWGWMASGALLIWGIMLGRSRFIGFPLNPLAFLVATGIGMSHLWLSFFVGWAIKTTSIKFGGIQSYNHLRPFMIGLILGNAAAIVFWIGVGFYRGSQIPYWPA